MEPACIDSEAISVKHLSSGADGDPVTSPRSTIDRLPEEILLEIFDAYRLALKHIHSHDVSKLRAERHHRYEYLLVPIYERHWNRIHGWFKLIHVCQKWRRIVLGSPSRLDLSLVLIEHNPSNMRTVYTSRLPPLPIRIDYECGPPTKTDFHRVVAALKQRDRMRGFAFKGKGLQLEKVLTEMKHPFPALERLEICHSRSHRLTLPPTFLGGSAPRLRRLNMCPVSLGSISHILTSATALVELSLKIDTIFGPSPTASLVAYLQSMPCLRWLALCLFPVMSHPHVPVFPKNEGKIVTLSNLTFFHFHGHRVSLDSLVSGLAAPSLRTFDIELYGRPSPIRNISRFMADINLEPESFKFRVISTDRGSFSLSLLAHSESIYDPDPHLNFYSRDVMRIGEALSPRLAIVEELFLTSFYKLVSSPSRPPWPRFLELFHNVKVIRLQDNIDVIFDFARSLEQDQCDSASVLPSLEEIELSTWPWSCNLRRDKRRSAMEAFEPFVAARQEAGRPVKIFWGEVHDVTWKFPTDFSTLP